MFSCCIIISCGLKENNVTKTKQWGPRLSYGSAGKESASNVGDLGSIPGLGRSPGEGKVYPLQYSGLKNSHSPWGHKESDTTERLSLHFTSLHFKDELSHSTISTSQRVDWRFGWAPRLPSSSAPFCLFPSLSLQQVLRPLGLPNKLPVCTPLSQNQGTPIVRVGRREPTRGWDLGQVHTAPW